MRAGLIALAFLLTACSSAKDSPPPPTPPASAPSSPKAPRVVEEQNYDFIYSRTCYCAMNGKVLVQVREGEVKWASYLTKRKEVFPFEKITINEMLSQARQEQAESQIDWPAETAYPRSIYIDALPSAVDDEVGYAIHSFTPSSSPYIVTQTPCTGANCDYPCTYLETYSDGSSKAYCEKTP